MYGRRASVSICIADIVQTLQTAQQRHWIRDEFNQNGKRWLADDESARMTHLYFSLFNAFSHVRRGVSCCYYYPDDVIWNACGFSVEPLTLKRHDIVHVHISHVSHAHPILVTKWRYMHSIRIHTVILNQQHSVAFILKYSSSSFCSLIEPVGGSKFVQYKNSKVNLWCAIFRVNNVSGR